MYNYSLKCEYYHICHSRWTKIVMIIRNDSWVGESREIKWTRVFFKTMQISQTKIKHRRVPDFFRFTTCDPNWFKKHEHRKKVSVGWGRESEYGKRRHRIHREQGPSDVVQRQPQVRQNGAKESRRVGFLTRHTKRVGLDRHQEVNESGFTQSSPK